MLKILVKAVFFILSSIATLIMTPILTVVGAIIPNTTNAISAILSWVTTSLTFVPFILKLLGVPIEAVSFYFSYLVLIFGVSATIRAIIFIKNIYYKFKP